MKKLQDKQYIVLGLGVFGSTVAKTLSKYNCEVIAIDKDIDCVQRVADSVTQSLKGDITSLELLKNAGAQDCDVAVVAVGSHLEESIMAVLNLKELGVPYILAKAKNKKYKQILEKVGADKVVRPEKEMGVVAAKGLLNKNIVDMVDLDSEYSVMEIRTPRKWLDKTLIEIDVRNKFGINIMGIRHNDGKLDVTPSPEYCLQADDHLLVISDLKDVSDFDFLDDID